MVSRLGIIVIGRNEGDRFRRCLDSLLGRATPIVYVDSGSTDGSIEYAREHGVDVLELDASIPFTAARARNAGFARLQELVPDVDRVMFVDGDCEVDPDWLPTAQRFLDEHDDYAVACGRRRERHPDASVYNYLCDIEWNTPVGDAKSCGGDAMMRAEAFAAVGGFNGELIAGEEPELCVRLRSGGWKIRRIDHDMTLHDANVTRFSQWWTRMVRGGHAFAEGASMHGAPPEHHWVKESRRAVMWGLVLPIFAIAASPFTKALSLALFLLYPLNLARIAKRLSQEGEPRPWTVATFLVLAKFPESLGWLRYQTGRLTGRGSKLIEYKAP
ncbi:MAG: glycosyl transferase [Gemmatimonas sp. SG8_38_2]|nr:MAG: glycosyl transferase [Gemmatimonas sp. SG8_38_2]